jgi:hypothetical protein
MHLLAVRTHPDSETRARTPGITAVKWYPAGATTNSQVSSFFEHSAGSNKDPQKKTVWPDTNFFGLQLQVKETELENLFPLDP